MEKYNISYRIFVLRFITYKAYCLNLEIQMKIIPNENK
jgi:hypothetical protein